MNTTADTRTQELNHYFMIMGHLATAKAADDVEAIAEFVDELEAISRWSDTAVIRQHAKAELVQVTALLADLQAKRLGCMAPGMVLTQAAIPANLN